MPPLEQANSDNSVSTYLTSVHSERASLAGSESTEKNKQGKEGRSPKKVFFNTSVLCRSIKSYREFSKKRKQRCWYSSSETKSIRDELLETIRKMADNKPLSPNETVRGLENKTPKTLSDRREEIHALIGFVLEEQNRFFTPVMENDSSSDGSDSEIDGPMNSSVNDEYLAALYRYRSRKFVSEAISIANMDAMEVWEFC